MADDKCTGIAEITIDRERRSEHQHISCAQTHTRGLYPLPLGEVAPAVGYSVGFYSFG